MDINESVSTYVTELQPMYRLFATKAQELVSSILKAKGIVPHSVTAREKDAASLKEKIERDTKAYDNPLEEITDLAGVRIITYFPKDVDGIVPLIESEFAIDRENSVDKRNVADPATFGYASVHLVVELSEQRCVLPEYAMFKGLKCEIQVRTILQHAWAEIEHDIVYKTTDEIPFELRRKFASLAGLLEVADREFEMLRNEEAQVRIRIAKTLKREEFDMPVNLDSVNLYLKSHHAEKPPHPSRASRLLKVLKTLDIATIQQLHDALESKALRDAERETEKARDACKVADSCLLKYIVAIGKSKGLSIKEIADLARCQALRDPEIFKMRSRERVAKAMTQSKRTKRVPNKAIDSDKK